MKNLLLFAVVSIFLFSCSKQAGGDMATPLMIRVSNHTTHSISAIQLTTPISAEPFITTKGYGSLSINQQSGYQQHESTYIFPGVKFTVDGQVSEFILRCPTGVPVVTSGKYSLVFREGLQKEIYTELIKD